MEVEVSFATVYHSLLARIYTSHSSLSAVTDIPSSSIQHELIVSHPATTESILPIQPLDSRDSFRRQQSVHRRCFKVKEPLCRRRRTKGWTRELVACFIADARITVEPSEMGTAYCSEYALRNSLVQQRIFTLC